MKENSKLKKITSNKQSNMKKKNETNEKYHHN